MAKETLEKIRVAEEEAERMTVSAEERALLVIAEAERKTAEEHEAVKVQCVAESNIAADAARLEADNASNVYRQETLGLCETLDAQLEKNKERAVSMLVRLVAEI